MTSMERQDIPPEYAAGEGEPVVDLSVPHPLQFRWTLWFDTTVNAKQPIGFTNWDQNLKLVNNMSTVENFWSTFNNIAEPSALMPSSTYHLFKEGIAPKWEDPMNEAGGKLTLMIPRKERGNLNQFWLNTVLMVIGEGFGPEESDDICGAVLSIRRTQDRIALWTRSAMKKELQESIEAQWRQGICEGGLNWIMEFSQHSDEKKRHAKPSKGGGGRGGF
mmetsp:Transcript_8011/g.24122  ORF Transcript_8011/g.24122 Transcript_8011/m.24122 type:complete len:219 (+) Transcript_8011:43-699(+)